MSEHELSEHDLSNAYDTIVVVGGGCYGSYYVTQLRRARAAGKITYHRIVVADRDPACAASTLAKDDPTVEIVHREWTAFFDDYLGSAHLETRDAIVPSPLMPHLMYEWLLRRAKERWSGRTVETVPLPTSPPTPWHRAAPDGTSYASYATWMCPINCVEPRKCPHTRSERTWTMPAAAQHIVQLSRAKPSSAEVAQVPIGKGQELVGPVIFHCTHRAYGVGMFDTRAVLEGDALVADAGTHGETRVLVGTVSHCHGAFNVLHVGA